MNSRKITSLVFVSMLLTSMAYCQSEALKPVVNNLAYFKQKKDLKYLANAKKSIDSLRKTKSDSADFEKSVFLAFVNANILRADTLNKLKQLPALLTQTIKELDKIAERKNNFKFQREIKFSRQCIANIYLQKGFKYLYNSDFINAVPAFKTAQRYDASFAPLNFYLGYSDRKLGKLEAAADYYDKLVSTDTVKAEYFEVAATTYQLIGDTAKALEIIKRARKIYPDDHFLLNAEANIYNNQKDYKSLAMLIKSLLDINPNNYDIAFIAANCYDHLAVYDRAEPLYRQAAELNDSAFDPAFNLGLLYLKRGSGTNNLLSAARWLEKANEISPNNDKSLKLLQLIYTKTGNSSQLNKVNNKLKELTN